MKWGTFSRFWNSSLAIFHGRQNFKMHCETLLEHMVLYVWALPDDDVCFQHDRATIHKSAFTYTWLEHMLVQVIRLPRLVQTRNPWRTFGVSLPVKFMLIAASWTRMKSLFFKSWQAGRQLTFRSYRTSTTRWKTNAWTSLQRKGTSSTIDYSKVRKRAINLDHSKIWNQPYLQDPSKRPFPCVSKLCGPISNLFFYSIFLKISKCDDHSTSTCSASFWVNLEKPP